MIRVNIKKMREMMGVSQEKMARDMDVSRETIRRIEAGNPVGLGLAMRIAHYFGSTVNGVWEDVQGEEQPGDDRATFVR